MIQSEILEQTMAQMPRVFTSNEFTRLAIKNGYPERRTKNGVYIFLQRYADNEGFRSKTWTKRETSKEINLLNFSNQDVKVELTEDEMIDRLKEKGYKIMKPIKDWQEC